MPKKANAASTSTAANGEVPTKRARLDTDHDEETSDGENRVKNYDQATLAKLLLKEMEKVAGERQKFKQFKFDQISIDGYTTEQLSAEYNRLRTAAIRNVRRLPMKREVAFVREFSRFEEPDVKKKNSKVKRPLTSYLRYLEETKPKVLEKHPEMAKDYKGLVQMIGEKWRNLSQEKKKKYEEAYKKEREEFYREHPELILSKKSGAKSKTPGGRTSRKMPQPKSAFELFSDSKRKEYAEKYDLKGIDLQKKLATKYQKLSERKRLKWENQARDAMEDYLQALAKTDGSQTATSATVSMEEIHDDPIFSPHDDPILANSPVDKPEKKSRAKKGTATDVAYAEYLDSLSKGETTSTTRPSKSPATKKAKTTFNAWLD